MHGFEKGNFTPLCQVKGSATDKLHDIRDLRLQEPVDSVLRMEDVCSLIPDSLAVVNLETTGYHRACNRNFIKNQESLQKRSTVAPQEASTSRSPSKRASSSAIQLFPPECIFCGKLEVKVLGKTERCIMFPVYNNKEPTWKQIEPQALELGLHRLHCMVQGHLFAREANYHQSCRKSFNLKYSTPKRVASQAEALDTNPLSETEESYGCCTSVGIFCCA